MRGSAKVGNILKTLRIQRGWSQEYVAEKIGITKSTISKYEKGLRGINHLQEFADLFEVDPIFILSGETNDEWTRRMEKEVAHSLEEERNYWESVLFTGYLADIAVAFEKLNDEGQQKAVERVEELTEIPKYRREETPPAGAEKPTEDK